MPITVISDRIKFFINRTRERLWVKPLASCVLSIAGALIAKLADYTQLAQIVPSVTVESVETLLSVMASGMLVIATFAVGSMVAAYGSASNTASPRSFALVIADDVSQHALSTFIGAFIFSIVGLIATKNGYFQHAGHFVLFILTIIVFMMVILTFVRWVDRIARLGRLGTTIEKVENATAEALKRRRDAPNLGGRPVESKYYAGLAIPTDSVGYLQHINIAALQTYAEQINGCIAVAVLPGSFIVPGRPLAYIDAESLASNDVDCSLITSAFLIDKERVFDDDPRFGLVVLSQIAARALSPAVNDPGTAIDILGILTRLFVGWKTQVGNEHTPEVIYDRVTVPELSIQEMFDDAFTAIARDGSGAVEVQIRLQKMLSILAAMGDDAMRDAAIRHAQRALIYAEKNLLLPEDIATIRKISCFAFDHPLEERY